MARQTFTHLLRIGCSATFFGLSVVSAWSGDVPGTKVVYSNYIEVEGGYDTNPDSLIRHTATPFGKLEFGGKAAAERPQELYELTYKLRGVKFEDLDIDNRWDGRIGLDMKFDLAPNQDVKIGSSYLRDFFSLNRADVVKSYADYSYRAEDFKVRLQAKSHIETNIERSTGLAPADPDVFDVIRGKAFDYSKTEGQVAFIGFTWAMVQPFVIYNFANVDYFNQVANPIIDRNAVDQFGIAGVRLDFGKAFRIDLGGRVNDRDFEDRDITRFRSSFFDMNFVWNPTSTLQVKAVIERLIKEPSTAFGLADDVHSYGITTDWKATEKLRFVVSAYYDRVVPIGDDFAFNKYTLTATSNYELASNLDWFVSGLAKWVNDDVTGESYTRFKLGSGFRMKF